MVQQMSGPWAVWDDCLEDGMCRPAIMTEPHVALGPAPCNRCGLPVAWVRLPSIGLQLLGVIQHPGNNHYGLAPHEWKPREGSHA